MLDFKALERTARAFVKSNSPEILTGLGVAGVVGTAVMTAKATVQAVRVLDEAKEYEESIGRYEPPTKRQVVALLWDLYIPAAATGAFSIVCIVGSNRISSKRAAAAYSLLAVSEKLYEEYREVVRDEVGAKKEQELRNTVAEKQALAVPSSIVLPTYGGETLCHELLTGRNFRCDVETLRRAQNDVNAKALANDYCTISEFYYIIGLEQTADSSNIGWTSSRQMELEFYPHLSATKEPALAFDYNYKKLL